MRLLTCALILSVLTSCGPAGKFDGGFEGTWIADTVFGKQAGTLRLTVVDDQVRGSGTNETIGSDFTVSGWVEPDDSQYSRVDLKYRYPDAGYDARGPLEIGKRGDGLTGVSGYVELSLDSNRIGFSEVTLTKDVR